MSKVRQPAGLIELLRNREAQHGDRVDAAMDLAAFDEAEVEQALIEAALNQDEDPDIADEVGHSLWEIWSRGGRPQPTLAAHFHPEARKFFSNECT